MWFYNHTCEMRHYGVKGMKWGVRRTKEQLKYDRGSIESILKKNALKTVTSNGILVKGISEHALDRAQGKDRAVTAKEIFNALKKPLSIEPTKTNNENGKRSQNFIGDSATVSVNPDTGNIITVYKTGSRRKRKYLKKGE